MTPKPTFVTTLTDEQWANSPVCERALHVASALQDVRETGNNAGTWVGRFLASVGLGTGYSWCAAFVYYCLTTAGADPKQLPQKRKAASVLCWTQWAEAKRIERGASNHVGPVRGHLFFWLNGTKGHIGFVRGFENGQILTIEGNTNKAGSREGDGVYRKARKLTDVDGFIDLSWLG